MRWKSGRRSTNVEDRRRSRGPGKVALGGGLGLILTIVGVLFFGVNPADLLSGGGAGIGSVQSDRELTAGEVEAGEFAATVLAYTEDVWKATYPELARAHPGAPSRYREPKMILFTGRVATACGSADSAVGPFYCPGDDQIYIDLTFFDELHSRFQAPGDFAQAYVIAHEVGHHIQHLLGITRKIDSERGRRSDEENNRLSVRLELQADFFAGVWANRVQARFDILEKGDVAEGLGAAGAVGDDRIQKRSRGYVVPESFTHGTAAQRQRWFKRGLESGDPLAYDPFKGRYEDL